MDHEHHIAACKRFYADGGYAKAPSRKSRLGSVEQALYASQYYADGGVFVAKAGDRRVSPVNGPLESTGENITDDWREIGTDKNGKRESWRPIPTPKTSELLMAAGGPVYTPPENMGHASPQKLAYASQFFASGGSVNRVRSR